MAINLTHFNQFPMLKTPRLELGKLTVLDIVTFMPIAMRGGKIVKTKEEALAILELNEKNYINQESITWALILSSRLIGVCGFYRGFKNNIGEIGYILNRDYHGNGYAKEAVNEIIQFGLNSLGLENIVAFTGADNSPSIKLLTSLGFVRTNSEIESLDMYSLKPL